MKRTLTVILTMLCLTVGIANAATEMAFVDIQEVFKRFYKTRLAQDQIRQQHEDIKFERETMEAEIVVMKEEIDTLRADARNDTLSDEARDNKRNQLEENLVELQRKEVEMADFEKLRLQQIEQQNSRMSKKLFDEIHESIVTYAKEKGFIGVVDRSAQGRNGMQFILYTSPKADITADIVAILNEGKEETLLSEPGVVTE